MFKEFREFAIKGNVIDMAVGIIIGGAFGTIVQSLVKDVIMPPIGLLLGNVDFSNLFLVLNPGVAPGPFATLDAAKEAGAVSLNYGLFINSVVSFTIVAVAVFFLVKGINNLKRERKTEETTAPASKECPHCFSKVDIRASRCPSCTSELGA